MNTKDLKDALAMSFTNGVANTTGKVDRRQVLRDLGITRQPYICNRCSLKFDIDIQPDATDDQRAVVQRCPRCGYLLEL